MSADNSLSRQEELTEFLSDNKGPDGRVTKVDDEDTTCGVGALKCCQSLARIETFVVLASGCTLVTQMLTIYLTTQISTIEKQFGLSSAQSGFLLSCNDIGFLITSLLASFAARRIPIPRTLATIVCVYGFAGIFCSFAYFVSKAYVVELVTKFNLLATETNSTAMSLNTSKMQVSSYTPLCKFEDEISSNSSGCQKKKNTLSIGEQSEYTTLALALIAIGMMVQGMAKGPRVSFITTYIDDNVRKSKTAMYMGVVAGCAMLGPVASLTIAATVSRRFVTLQDVNITPRHPAWIGAWWLGFVVIGVISIVIGLPLCSMPRRLRSRHNHSPLKPQPANSVNFKGFWRCVCRLAKNPVYSLMILTLCFKAFGAAGAGSFIIKYLEIQFYLPTWKASLMLGSVNVLTTVAGTVLGGCVVTKKKLSPLGCIKLLLVVCVVTVLLAFLGLTLNCGTARVVGFHHNGSNASCSTTCGCDESRYFPVCGEDGNNYMSPCHAGCTSLKNQEYRNCSCIADEAIATPGLCDTTCPMLFPYLIFIASWISLEGFGAMPLLNTIIRSVQDEDKSMAVGGLTFFQTLCGWFLAPVIFGFVIDTNCVIWNTSCTGQGACALYNVTNLRLRYYGLFIGVKTITVLVLIAAFLKARHKGDWSVDNDDKNGDLNEMSQKLEVGKNDILKSENHSYNESA